MTKRLLSIFLLCCMLATVLPMNVQADGAPLYVEYLDGDGVDAMPGASGEGWGFQGRGPAVLTLNNFQGKYIVLQFDVPMYGNMEINLTNSSVNTMKHLLSSLNGELTIKGNGMLLIKSDDNDPAVDLHESTLKIAEPLRMIGGVKEGDKNPLTIRDGKAVTSDGKAATYVAFIPSGSEGNIPAFPVDAGDASQREEFPDVPSDISYSVAFRSEEKYELNQDPIGYPRGMTAVGNAMRFLDMSQDRDHQYHLVEYTGSGIRSVSEYYSSISNFSESGYARIEGRYTPSNGGNPSGDGIIDKTGRVVLEVGPNRISANEITSDGYANVYNVYDHNTVLLNLKDSSSTKLEYAGTYGGYNDGLIPSYASDGKGTWKYLDINGNVVIDTQITDEYANQNLGTYSAGTFSHGYAIVRVKANDKRVYGIIDKTGKATFTDTEKKYQSIGSVSAEGVAVAQVSDDVYDYIDIHGNVIIPGGYSEAEMFHNGYAVVYKRGQHGSGGYGLIDIAGHVVIPFGTYNSLSNASDTGLVWAIKSNFNESSRTFYNTVEILKLAIRPTQFSDVPEGAYYVDAVKWAVAQGVTNGVSATNFAPDDICSRGQVATFLWRANGSPEPTTTENPFVDVDPSSAFYKAILWAAENGITSGTSDTTFSPGNPCTRAHVVTFLWRSQGKPAATGAAPLADSLPQGYYTDAVRWADSVGLLNGTGEAFAPSALCPRADIVTYLYRVLNR